MSSLTPEQIKQLSYDEQLKYLNLLKELEEQKLYNKQYFFSPYPFQADFYSKGKDQKVRALIAANRVGKTYSAAMELTYHLTGDYPAWWEGRRWDKPIKAVAAGISSTQVRKVIQKELVGTENRDVLDELGTGTIPKDKLEFDKCNKSRDGGYSEIVVKHKSGGSSVVSLFAYTQGMEPMQGFTADFIWVDEQDRAAFDDIFGELVKRTMTVQGSVIATFTPMQGITHIVNQFWDVNGPFHSGLVNAGWDDAPHLKEEEKAIARAATPPHLLDAVMKGIPVMGSGAVFAISEEEIVYDDVAILPHWPRICAVDVGFTIDPTAGIFVAKDMDGVYYIYDEYGDVSNNTFNASEHVGHLHAKNCSSIPIVYDSAAAAKTGAVGKSVIEMWREMGLKVLPESFKNPDWLIEGNKYKSIAPGLMRMYELMKSGKLKVNKNCHNWWREFRKYSYNDKGIPIDKDNHWMDASRYAIMSAERGLMQITGNDWNAAYRMDEPFFQTYS